MTTTLTRRDFLKLGLLGLASLAFNPLNGNFPFEEEFGNIMGYGRVTISEIPVFSQPDYQSTQIGKHLRDEILPIYQEICSPEGPHYNPRWYLVIDKNIHGYVHSGYIQKVETHQNPYTPAIPKDGMLSEVTVPYTQSMRFTKLNGWMPLYRLYYQSMHWVTGLDEGPDGEPWYRILDDLLKVEYFTPAQNLRLVPRSEISPISPEVPLHKKLIEVSLRAQTLTAYENDQIVLKTKISSGLGSLPSSNGVPTTTPTGRFNIQNKMPLHHMGNGALTDDIEAYELPGVPWVSFFTETGVAFHGTYWHDNFGTAMSHGCVNMRPEEAKWLFRWTLPVNYPPQEERKGFGTPVLIY